MAHEQLHIKNIPCLYVHFKVYPIIGERKDVRRNQTIVRLNHLVNIQIRTRSITFLQHTIRSDKP